MEEEMGGVEKNANKNKPKSLIRIPFLSILFLLLNRKQMFISKTIYSRSKMLVFVA